MSRTLVPWGTRRFGMALSKLFDSGCRTWSGYRMCQRLSLPVISMVYGSGSRGGVSAMLRPDGGTVPEGDPGVSEHTPATVARNKEPDSRLSRFQITEL